MLLKNKEAFYFSAGENIRAVTHIDDVVYLFNIPMGEAVKGGDNAQWGREVFHFLHKYICSAICGILVNLSVNRASISLFRVVYGVAWKDATEVINNLGVENCWLPRSRKAVQ